MRALKTMAKRILGRGSGVDYREALFEELRRYLAGARAARILELGPKDGADTRRLLRLDPKHLVLVDLPRLEEANRIWLRQLDSSAIQYLSANIMYSAEILALEPFDLVWCTGVLYHNPEQLRMVRRLYDLLTPGGALVLESATARSRGLRGANCVEIVYPPSPELKRKYHISANISHLPSERAIASWLAMVGFERILRSTCHAAVSPRLARSRAAFLAAKPRDPRAGRYYAFSGEDGYEIGKAL